MTQTLPIRDPNDEHARLIEQTLRLSLGAGEATQPIRPYDQWVPSLRSADATEEIAVHEPPLLTQLAQPVADELLDLDDRPPNPSWNERFDGLPTVRSARPDQTAVIYQPAHLIPGMQEAPDGYRPRHRRAPRWTKALIAVGSLLAVGAAFTLGVLAGSL